MGSTLLERQPSRRRGLVCPLSSSSHSSPKCGPSYSQSLLSIASAGSTARKRAVLSQVAARNGTKLPSTMPLCSRERIARSSHSLPRPTSMIRFFATGTRVPRTYTATPASTFTVKGVLPGSAAEADISARLRPSHNPSQPCSACSKTRTCRSSRA